MATQFLFQAVVEFNQEKYYFGHRSDSAKLGHSMLIRDVKARLGCKADEYNFSFISIEAEPNDNLPF